VYFNIIITLDAGLFFLMESPLDLIAAVGTGNYPAAIVRIPEGRTILFAALLLLPASFHAFGAYLGDDDTGSVCILLRGHIESFAKIGYGNHFIPEIDNPADI
jgi:hypothetical protein